MVGWVGGGVALSWLCDRSVGAHLAVACLTAVGAAAIGAAVAARAMFIYLHGIDAVLVVLAAAGTAAILVGLALRRRFEATTGTLRAAARGIGEGGPPKTVREPPTRELAVLARELEEASRRLKQPRARERALDMWVSHDLRTPLAAIRAVAEASRTGWPRIRQPWLGTRERSASRPNA
jgi:signal transduction histidine kinase